MALVRLTKDQLNEKYPDEEWRRRFVDISLLVQFLESCVIKRGYRVPDEMNSAIQLTEYGKGFMTELTRQQVPTKEARLLCLLETAHVDPLVDVMATDLDKLKQSVGQQAQARDIQFPFIYGRELYDRAAELFPDQRLSLTVEDTALLLDQTSQGVFQNDKLLCGPYGLLESDAQRWLAPTLRIPLFSCADMNCHSVHHCSLSTDWDATINEERRKINKLLRKDGQESSDWGDFVADLMAESQDRYNDFNGTTLPFVLGDCLSSAELRALIVWTLDAHPQRGTFRSRLGALGLSSSSSARMTENLTRAQIMQLLLLLSDATLAEGLNALISDDVIKVPAGEIRRPVVNAGVRAGRFGVQAQIGAHGVRYKTFDSSMANLRLRRLVDVLFRTGDPSDTPELEWQLRGVDSPTIEAKLDHYLRIETPRAVLARLVLASRLNVITACTELGIDEHRFISDEQLIDTMLWKLGFTVSNHTDVNEEFWQYQDRMEQVVRTAGVSPLVDQDDLRARGSNYFVRLEQALDDSLAFTTWCLVFDHYSAEAPFRYTVDSDRTWSFEWLSQKFEEANPDVEPEHKLVFGERNNLGTLIRGFQFLASELIRLKDRADEFSRPNAYRPKFVGKTDLQLFPFSHTHPFLDLTEASQMLIVDTFNEISKGLLDGDVAEVRNEQLHFRRSSADLEKLRKALQAAKAAVGTLEEAGMTRLVYDRASTQQDAWSRTTVILRNPRGREAALVEPTPFDWLRLPSSNARQLIFTSAQLAEPNGLLRFLQGYTSDYANMWADFPKRRKLSPTLSPLRAREEPRNSSEPIAVHSD